jgi:hypothetical protein
LHLPAFRSNQPKNVKSISFQNISYRLKTKNNSWFRFDPSPGVADNEIGTLNVAGPRASKKPEVGEFVMAVLAEVFPA